MNCEHLKVGDTVSIISSRHGRSFAKIATVEKVNKATIKVDGRLFSINKGWERGGDKWFNDYIESYEKGLEIIAKNELS